MLVLVILLVPEAPVPSAACCASAIARLIAPDGQLWLALLMSGELPPAVPVLPSADGPLCSFMYATSPGLGGGVFALVPAPGRAALG